MATNITFVDYQTIVPADWLNNVNAFVNATSYPTSITNLRQLSKLTFVQAIVTGYYTHGDGGGGVYYYDPLDTTSLDNGGTIIVAVDGGRWKLSNTREVSIDQFGAKGDGVTDDTAAIQNAINAAFGTSDLKATNGRNYKISATLQIGNGSNSAPSTINGLSFTGIAAGAVGAEVTSAGAPVLFTWAGSSGGTMMQVNGPVYGLNLKGFTLNCASIAGTGLNLSHPIDSRVEEVLVENYTGTGIVHTAYPAPTGCVTGSQHNTFIGVHAKAPAAGGSGIIIGANTYGASPHLDVAQNTYIGCNWWFDATSNVTYGIALQFSDNNTFVECTTFPENGSLGVGLFINPPTGGTTFPLETTFINCALQGGVNDPSAWTTTTGIGFFPYPVGDGQPQPVSPNLGQFYGYATFGNLIGGLLISTASARISNHYSVTSSLTFPSAMTSLTSNDQTIAVAGATIGDTVTLGLPSIPTAGFMFSAFVSAAGVVTVRCLNGSSSTGTPFSGAQTYRVDVWHH